MDKDTKQFSYTATAVKKKFMPKAFLRSEQLWGGETSVNATIMVSDGTEDRNPPKPVLNLNLGGKKINIVFEDSQAIVDFISDLQKFVNKWRTPLDTGHHKAMKTYRDKMAIEIAVKTGKILLPELSITPPDSNANLRPSKAFEPPPL